MARINLYVRDEDQALFEKAKELLGDEKISPVVAEAIRRLVEEEEAKKDGFEEIELEVGISGSQPGESDNFRRIRFVGKELSNYTRLEGRERQGLNGQIFIGDDRGKHWRLFLSRKGKFLLYLNDWSYWRGEFTSKQYEIFDSLEEIEEFEGFEVPEKLLNDAKEELGEDVSIRLDI